MQRRRFKQTVSLGERLADQAKRFREDDQLLSPGFERDRALRKARQAENGLAYERLADIAGLAGTEMRPTEEAPKGTPLIEGAAQVLRRARKLPIGEARNELRHLARIMIRLHRIGFRADIEIMKKHTIH